jgi:hypothetical protein
VDIVRVLIPISPADLPQKLANELRPPLWGEKQCGTEAAAHRSFELNQSSRFLLR